MRSSERKAATQAPGRSEELTDAIRSRDGTIIRYTRRGRGAPLLLIHGTNADHTVWSAVVPMLEKHFTVFAMDRRGHPGSEHGDSYRIDCEIDDIAALAGASGGEPVNILGHSFGAVCALEAARRIPRVRSLALYEPPIPTYPDAYFGKDLIKTVRRLLTEHKSEAAIEAFYTKAARVPKGELAMMRSRPAWISRVKDARVILRELEIVAHYELKPELFQDWRVPTLLLLGGDSSRPYHATIAKLNAILPGSTIAVLNGQRHTAMTSAPASFAREILAFIQGCPLGPNERGAHSGV